jgi:tyrosyl-tRNA synthetase
MLHATTPGLPERLATGRPISGYNGFDPSGPWLHIGHLVPIMGLLQLQRHGGRPVVLVGGGTGMIGDPSGTSAERNLLDRETLATNVASIHGQLERFLDFSGPTGALMVNNLDWLGEIGLIEWLRDVGKHFTIPYMLAKDSVQGRLDRGLSFTEFSYMLVQATDFEHLHRTMGVELQMGGADQWGNITAGLELIRRRAGLTGEGEADRNSDEPAHGLAYKLLLSASGTKFGKTAGGDTIWLDAGRTSPYAFYQYWLNVDDRDVGTYLRWFTLLGRDEIEALEAEGAARPEGRAPQRALARDVTERTHGAEATDRAITDSEAMFSTEALTDPDALESLFASTSGHTFTAQMLAAGVAVLLAESGILPSRGEARRLIASGGVVVNGERITDPVFRPSPIADRWLDVKIGKRRRVVLRRA